MKPPAICRSPQLRPARPGERGVTMVLMALAMVAILAMAALSIDVVTLYLANAEAQRSADTAALAAARVLSITGMTGDPSNSGAINPWQQACALATSVAKAVATQNTMGGIALLPAQVTVTFPNNSDTQFCNASGPNLPFGVNPLVTVKVQRTDLPTFFARIWGRKAATVSATATAEAFNSSNSGNVGNTITRKITPVQPRCVKPWIVPNQDPGNGVSCTGAGCPHFVTNPDGSITTQGIMVNNAPPGVIGRTFDLFADCAGSGPCATGTGLAKSPQANAPGPKPNLQYIPGQLPASFTAVPACAVGSDFQEAVAGCDQTTVYHCGNEDQPSTVDLGQNNVKSDSVLGGQCLIRATDDGPGMGQDSLDTTSYPYKIKAGSANLLGLSTDSVITSSSSIVSLPIYDSAITDVSGEYPAPPVPIIGFLQVFINSVNSGNNSVNVTVLNVTGCGNNDNNLSGAAVSGTSPVPVRLIQYP